MRAWDTYDPMRGQCDEEGAAGPAPVVGVDAVVGLLLTDILEGLVLAGRHGVIALGSGFRPLEGPR